MSSHHIVRDEQEPALLIENAGAIPFDFVELLLEWSPKIYVLSSALDEVLEWQIKIDVVLAHQDEVESLKPKLKPQSPVKLLVFEPNEDLLSASFQVLKDFNHQAVNILAEAFQSDVLDLIRVHAEEVDSVLFYNAQKWVYSSTGNFQKWVTLGEIFGVHPIVPGTYFKTQGFIQNLENEPYLEPFELTSEIQGKVRIESNQKPFWLIEELRTDVYR